MRSLLLCIIVFLDALVMHSFAQPLPRTSIEDSVIGWAKVYNFKGEKAGAKLDNRVYSANQISICDSFANWIQASYIPKGGIGDIKKVIFPKASIYSPYNTGL